jgi:WD40 repeat protein
MGVCRRAAWSLLLLFLAFPIPAAIGPPLLRDQQGEPLPVGARARLGTARFRMPPRVQGDSKRLILSPDRRLAAWTAADGRIRIIRTDTGVTLRHVGTAQSLLGNPSHRAVAFSPDGRLVALLDEQWVLVWERSTGRRLARMRLPKELTAAVLVVTDAGRVLVAGDRSPQDERDPWPAQVAVWSAHSRRYLFTTPDRGERLRDKLHSPVSLSPDGRTLAVAQADSTILLFNVP